MLTNAIVFAMAEEYWFQEGCFISEWSNTHLDPECSIARARVLPGHTTKWHKLTDTTERYAILSGIGKVELVGAPAKIVNVSDVVVIPPNIPQRITNVGEEDLLFLAICTPRFTQECYQEIPE